jgi:hypothetical protein
MARGKVLRAQRDPKAVFGTCGALSADVRITAQRVALRLLVHPEPDGASALDPHGPANILLVQNTADPSTAASGAERTRAAFGHRAGLVTVDAAPRRRHLPRLRRGRRPPLPAGTRDTDLGCLPGQDPGQDPGPAPGAGRS